MYPFLNIFGTHIASYYVCAALAGIVGFLLAARALKGKVSKVWRWLLPILTEVLAVTGARLFNVWINPSNYGKDFHAWTISYSHLSLIGGLALGLIGILIFCLIARKDPRTIVDSFVLSAGFGIVILKLGCFLNGCCYGKKTSLPWGMKFPSNRDLYRSVDLLGLFSSEDPIVHPTQLYEILGALIALALALLLQKHLSAGGAAAIFAGAFCIARWIVLPYRLLSYPKYVITTLYPILYGVTALLCFAYAGWSFHAARKKASRAAGGSAGAFAKEEDAENEILRRADAQLLGVGE